MQCFLVVHLRQKLVTEAWQAGQGGSHQGHYVYAFDHEGFAGYHFETEQKLPFFEIDEAQDHSGYSHHHLWEKVRKQEAMFLGCSQAKVVHTGVADRAGWLPMVRTRPCDWLSTTLLPSQIGLPFDFQLLLNNSILHQWVLTESSSVAAYLSSRHCIDTLVTGIYTAATFSGRLEIGF